MRNVSRVLRAGVFALSFLGSGCSLVGPALRAVVGALDMAVPVADTLRRGSTDWEAHLADLGKDDPDALELAMTRVLRNLDRAALAPGAPQAEGSAEDALGASRARQFLAARKARR